MIDLKNIHLFILLFKDRTDVYERLGKKLAKRTIAQLISLVGMNLWLIKPVAEI